MTDEEKYNPRKYAKKHGYQIAQVYCVCNVIIEFVNKEKDTNVSQAYCRNCNHIIQMTFKGVRSEGRGLGTSDHCSPPRSGETEQLAML